jgi:hypothetical protein
MTDQLRKKLAKRAKQQIALISGVTPKELLRSPSEKRSIQARKKFAKRGGVKEAEPPQDCYGCEKDVVGKTCNLNTCEERAMVHRCLICGQKVRHRIVAGNPWLHCPSCRGG